MSNQRGTFAKRQREMELKDKARQKEARRAARADRRDQGSNGGGPAWDEAVRATVTPDAPTNSVVPTDDSAD
jgi:hypothetical protein